MNVIYHLGLYLFNFLLFIGKPFNKRAKLWIKGRQGIYDQIAGKLMENERRMWIHAASLGEFEQGRPVIEEIKKQSPHLKIVLTFFSPSGYEIRKDYPHVDYVFYLPLDTSANAKKFINLLKPEFVIFIKYEFWPNFLNTLKNRRIPTFLISAIFRKDQVFFHWYGKWYRKILESFTWFFVQNEESKTLLNQIGYQNITISGDTRFDRVSEIAQQVKSFPVIEKFAKDHYVIILGSSWKADEDILWDYINNESNNIRFIIAPHEIHESNILRIIKNISKKTIRYSQALESMVNEYEILIIDNIGMLSSIYQYGTVAYIGGGFGSGIHNILEPATFGLPVLFGPDYHKFQEAIDLIEQGGAFEVSSKTMVTEKLEKLFIDEKYCKEAGNICRKYVGDKKGATYVITEHIQSYLK